MVMVRLNHVTTRYDRRYDQMRSALTLTKRGRRLSTVGMRRHSPAAVERPATLPANTPGKIVLDDLSLTILDGETLSIIGPSACGKSTLLRVIAGLIRPESGEVYFDAQSVQEYPPSERRIGMVFQNYALYPHLAAMDNMGFFWRLRQRPPPEINDRVRQTAQLLDIDVKTLLARFPRQLSGGEQQRVAVGRCLTREPTVFLLDEPFSNLDAQLRERSRREVKKLLAMFAVTTVFVTHDQHEAIAMGDRIAVMRDGKIVQVGTYQELYADPHDSFVAGFLGDPPLSLLPGDYCRDTQQIVGAGGLAVRLGSLSHQLEHGQGVLLGIRPEHVQLHAPDAAAMRGRISHFEPRITERIKIAYIDLMPGMLAAKVPYEMPVAMGDLVGIGFDRAGLLVFDAETHRRLPVLSPG